MRGAPVGRRESRSGMGERDTPATDLFGMPGLRKERWDELGGRD